MYCKVKLKRNIGTVWTNSGLVGQTHKDKIVLHQHASTASVSGRYLRCHWVDQKLHKLWFQLLHWCRMEPNPAIQKLVWVHNHPAHSGWMLPSGLCLKCLIFIFFANPQRSPLRLTFTFFVAKTMAASSSAEIIFPLKMKHTHKCVRNNYDWTASNLKSFWKIQNNKNKSQPVLHCRTKLQTQCCKNCFKKLHDINNLLIFLTE